MTTGLDLLRDDVRLAIIPRQHRVRLLVPLEFLGLGIEFQHHSQSILGRLQLEIQNIEVARKGPIGLGDLGIILILAQIAIFAVLVLQFRSILQPLIVFSAIP